jgi:hypothetical protein
MRRATDEAGHSDLESSRFDKFLRMGGRRWDDRLDRLILARLRLKIGAGVVRGWWLVGRHRAGSFPLARGSASGAAPHSLLGKGYATQPLLAQPDFLRDNFSCFCVWVVIRKQFQEFQFSHMSLNRS